uniref:Outer membrane lipoprotein carrier protein LolA n=1 Tax=Desulfomonile tiedjei TaxID=2358 RepID=A0A7C4ASY5_9BACT
MRRSKNKKYAISKSLGLSFALWAAICVAPTLCLAQSSGLSLSDVVARMRNVYSKQCCFKASFDQLTVNVSMDMRDKFQGTMYVRRPSSIALDVETPEKQKVVVQGKSYAVFFPQDGSVVRGDVPPEMNVEQFFGFFADIAGIDRHFDMNFPEKAVDTVENLIFLELTDKKTEQPTYRILLGIDVKAFTVRRAVIYDALGNYNRFDLSNVTFLSSLPDSQFSINAPASHGNRGKQPNELSEKD